MISPSGRLSWLSIPGIPSVIELHLKYSPLLICFRTKLLYIALLVEQVRLFVQSYCLLDRYKGPSVIKFSVRLCFVRPLFLTSFVTGALVRCLTIKCTVQSIKCSLIVQGLSGAFFATRTISAVRSLNWCRLYPLLPFYDNFSVTFHSL